MRREGIWYFHKLVNGKREFSGRKTPFSLETTDLVVAKAKRDALLKAAAGEEVDRVRGRTDANAATLGDIFDVYMRSPMVRANLTTRRRNLADLERMITLVKGAGFDVQGMSSRELTWHLVEHWQSLRMEGARRIHGTNLASFEAAKRGINSILRSIQSVFSTQARAAYRALHLPPNVADFATALPVPARRQEAPTHLSDSFVVQLMQNAEQLREEDPSVWVVFQLMTWGGLRNREAYHARRSWLERGFNGYQLTLKPTEEFVPKGNSRSVVIPSDVARAILVIPAVPNPRTGLIDGDFLVPGIKKRRYEACFYGINTWLKAQGVSKEVGKVAYRLRKYFLKKVAVQQHPLMAQAAGGHSSISTTENHYIGKPQMTEPIRMPVDLSKVLSYRVTERPLDSIVEIGTILSLHQAAQLLEVNAGELAARSERAESVAVDGYVLTIRREGGVNGGVLTPAPATPPVG